MCREFFRPIRNSVAEAVHQRAAGIFVFAAAPSGELPRKTNCGVLTAKGITMKESEVRERAFAMPLTSPAFPRGPYRFCQREYLIIEYRTHFEKLKALVPEPLESP